MTIHGEQQKAMTLQGNASAQATPESNEKHMQLMTSSFMTNRRWKTLRGVVAIAVSIAVLVALSAWPLNRLPSSTSIPASSSLIDLTSAAKLQEDPTAASSTAGGATKAMAPTVAVIGSGLAGLSAAYEVSKALQAELPQAKVVIFEKNPILGGNSAKASSGINAVNSAAGDSIEAYAADTTKSGGGYSAEGLVSTLAVGATG